MSQGPLIAVDVLTDIVCPWCYIGKRRLAKGLSLRPAARYEVRWHPFQLDPSIPSGGLDRQEYLRAKFGEDGRVEAIHERLRELGREDGIDFAFERITHSPNTLDAHRLVRLAVTPELQANLMERLFELYFVEGQDIGDRVVLADAAAGVLELDPGEIHAFLAGDGGVEDVRRAVDAARNAGIDGVPCAIIGGKYALMGAQSPETIASAIDHFLG
jgi:predicted DsbA family dithiol-disulfide isomerase